MNPGDSSSPEQRIEELLTEREDYIRRQEAVRDTRTTTELKLLLWMIDERSAEDPYVVRQIRETHVEDDSLPSFDTLYSEWKRLGYEIDRLETHQQRVEINIATCVLDTDEKVVADLDEAIETVLTMRDESPDEYTDDASTDDQ
jgi:hypothetical protein